MASTSPVIAYLAPEIPAHSATFVYEEILAMEKRGVVVMPFSVHHPLQPATGQDCLARRVVCLYDTHPILLALKGLWQLFGVPNCRRGIGLLVSDMRECGLLSKSAWKLVYQFLVAAQLAKLLVKNGCVHLHIHFAHVPTQIGMYAAALVGLPFTVMAHANDIFERGLLLPRKAERAHKFLTISEFNRAYLQRCGVLPAKLAVVRCGVSFPVRATVLARPAPLTWRLGTLGRLVEKKGVDVLMRALALLRSRGRSVTLVIAGDGPLRGELEALAVSLGLSDSVHFVGNLPHAQVCGWMHGLDFFALACKPDANGDMDGIPVVLMEAMSQQLPVVSARLSGIPELVIHDTTGLLFEPGDACGLADGICRLIDEPGLRQKLAQRGAAHVRNEFSQAINIERLLRQMNISL